MGKVNVDVAAVHVEAVGDPEQEVEELEKCKNPHAFNLDIAEGTARDENAKLVAEIEDNE